MNISNIVTCKELEIIKFICERLDIKFIVVDCYYSDSDYGLFEEVCKEHNAIRAPFWYGRYSLNLNNRVLLCTDETYLWHIIHEMMHVGGSYEVPDKCNELDYIGWELAVLEEVCDLYTDLNIDKQNIIRNWFLKTVNGYMRQNNFDIYDSCICESNYDVDIKIKKIKQEAIDKKLIINNLAQPIYKSLDKSLYDTPNNK